MAAANVRADELGLASWLSISNVKNTAFYEYLGFVTVHEYTMGEASSSWARPPVVVRIMVRESQHALATSLDYL